MVDRSLEDGARQRVLTATARRRLNSPTLFSEEPQWPLTQLNQASEQSAGRTHGPITRLMSPYGLGEILKPFVFLDLSDRPLGRRRIGRLVGA